MKLLVIDKEKKFRVAAKKLLSQQGWQVLTAASCSQARKHLECSNIHVVILAATLPDRGAVETLKKIKQHFPMAQIIVLTERENIAFAAEGLRLGAIDYLIKPAKEEKLLRITAEAFEKRVKLEKKIRCRQVDILEQQFGCAD